LIDTIVKDWPERLVPKMTCYAVTYISHTALLHTSPVDHNFITGESYFTAFLCSAVCCGLVQTTD